MTYLSFKRTHKAGQGGSLAHHADHPVGYHFECDAVDAIFQLLSYFFILFCFFKLFWEIVTGIFIVDGAVVDIVV